MSAAFLMLGQLGRDFRASLARWPMWSYIGWNDIAQQYRRSFIGPVWITLSTGIFIVGFSFTGASLFNTGAGDRHFVEKAKQRIERLMEKVGILALSSHDMSIIRRFRNRCVLLGHGQVVHAGKTEECIARYLSSYA